MNETLQSSAADRIKEIERLKLSSHTMSEEIESVREELIGFQQRLQKSEREKEALRQSLEEVQEKHRSETLEANNHIDRVGAELTKLQRRMQTMAKEKRELTTQLENQSVSIQRVLQKRGGASGKGHQSMLTLEKLAFQNKIVTLEGTCRRLNEEHQDAQSQLREKEAELNELRQQHQMTTEALQKERKKTVNNGSKSSGRDHAAGEAMTKKRENNLQRENAKLIERLAILQDKLKSSPVPASSSAAASSSLPKNHSSLNHNEDARNFRDSYRQQRKELNRIKERHNSAQEKLAKAEETIVQLTRSMDTMTAEKTESEGGCAQHLKSLAEAVISLRTERAKAQQEKQEREVRARALVVLTYVCAIHTDILIDVTINYLLFHMRLLPSRLDSPLHMCVCIISFQSRITLTHLVSHNLLQ